VLLRKTDSAMLVRGGNGLTIPFSILKRVGNLLTPDALNFSKLSYTQIRCAGCNIRGRLWKSLRNLLGKSWVSTIDDDNKGKSLHTRSVFCLYHDMDLKGNTFSYLIGGNCRECKYLQGEHVVIGPRMQKLTRLMRVNKS